MHLQNSRPSPPPLDRLLGRRPRQIRPPSAEVTVEADARPARVQVGGKRGPLGRVFKTTGCSPVGGLNEKKKHSEVFRRTRTAHPARFFPPARAKRTAAIPIRSSIGRVLWLLVGRQVVLLTDVLLR